MPLTTEELSDLRALIGRVVRTELDAQQATNNKTDADTDLQRFFLTSTNASTNASMQYNDMAKLLADIAADPESPYRERAAAILKGAP